MTNQIEELQERYNILTNEVKPTFEDFPSELTGNYKVVLPNIAVEDPRILIGTPDMMEVALRGCRLVMAEVYQRVAGSSDKKGDLINLQLKRDEEYSRELLDAVRSNDTDKQTIARAQALLVINNASSQYRDLFPQENH